MAVVGHPLWLWTDGPTTLTSANSDYGLTVTLDAKLVRTTFSMGDGGSVTCTRMTPYVRGAVKPGTPSPTCGYTYEQAPTSGHLTSLNKTTGSYPVKATAHWSIDWSAAGYSGTLTTTMTDARDLPVGELQAVVTR